MTDKAMPAYPIQNSFFDVETPEVSAMRDLSYASNFISPEEEAKLLNLIDNQPWLTDLKRRIQHYGWKYDYTARRVDDSMRLGDLPDWLLGYCQKLKDEGYFTKTPDQVIINEYQPGQGIAPHVDCVPCFRDTIASLSLGSPCVMELTSPAGEKQSILLEPRSLLTLSGKARYQWKHGIAGRKTDKIGGQVFTRSRRVSLTFRNVLRD